VVIFEMFPNWRVMQQNPIFTFYRYLGCAKNFVKIFSSAFYKISQVQKNCKSSRNFFKRIFKNGQKIVRRKEFGKKIEKVYHKKMEKERQFF